MSAAVAAGQPNSGPDVAMLAVLLIALVALVALVAAAFSPRARPVVGRTLAWAIGGVFAFYLIGRGIAEFWVVNYSDPGSYRGSWGGPSLAGVFAVHTGPGVLILVGISWWLRHRRMAQPITRR
jgi:hypothetical protein